MEIENMAWKVIQYLGTYDAGGNHTTYTDVNDAKTKIGLATAHTDTTGSPTTTYALEDSGQTLKVTYSFDTWDNQTTWYNGMSSTWYTCADGLNFNYKKMQWINEDDSVRHEEVFSYDWS